MTMTNDLIVTSGDESTRSEPDLMDGWFTNDPPPYWQQRKCRWARKGRACRRWAIKDSLYCSSHQPKGSKDAVKKIPPRI